jgi:hypothetical protein
MPNSSLMTLIREAQGAPAGERSASRPGVDTRVEHFQCLLLLHKQTFFCASSMSEKCQVRTWPLSPTRCVSGVAAWIVTNKADGLGLSFSATDAEYAWGFERIVDDRTITVSRSSFRRRGESTPCARANSHNGVFSLRPPPPRPWSQCLMSAAHMRPAN